MTTPQLAKLTPPRLAKVYNRTHLFKQLDKARDKPVIWISAPAGSGKTTLVASYLKEKKIKPLWYQVDEGDSDIASFFYYLGLLAPKKKKDLPLLTPEYLLGLPTFTRNFFRELFSRMKSPGVLVLDNFQDAGTDIPLHELLPVALQEIPEGITVMIVSRQDPPQPFARLQVSKDLRLFGWETIRLELNESIAIGKLHSGKKKVSDETFAQIHDQTQGWTAGLVLFVESSGDVSFPDALKGSANQQTIFNYFASELFERVSEDEQEFLLKTALFPEIDTSDAIKLTGQTKAEKILEDLCKQNFFTIRRAHTKHAYAYHPLFREFLRKRAKDYFSAEELADYQQRTAILLEERGKHDEAATLYTEISDWENLARILMLHAQEILAQGKWQTLQKWIASIPEKIVENEPWLLFWQAASKLPVDLVDSREDYFRAYHKFMERNDAVGAYLAWAGAVDTFFYIWVDFFPLDYWIEEFEQLKSKFPRIPSLDIEARVTYAMFGALLWRRPDKPEIREWCAHAEEMLEKAIDPTLKLMTGSLVVQYYLWWRGDMIKVRSIRHTLAVTSRQENANTLAQLMWKVMDSAYMALNNEMEKSHKIVSDGLAMASESGVYHTNFLLYAQIIYASLVGFENKRAQAALEKLDAMLQSIETFDHAHFHYLSSWNAMAEGDIQSAIDHAFEALKKAEKVGGSNYQIFAKFTLAEALVENGGLSQAEELMEEVRVWGKEVGNHFIECQYNMLKAYIALCRSDNESGLAPLKEAIVLAKQQNYVAIPWIGVLPDILAKLYRQALINDIESDYVSMVIRKRSLLPPPDQPIPENWPFPIKLYTLGRFSLVIDDVPVVFKGKAQKKPLDLLKGLICLGGRGVGVQKLAEAVWPDAEGDAAYQSFTMTLKRLRELIGKKEALVLSDGKLTLDPQYVWVDVWTIAQASQQDDTKQLQQALDLYQGTFLDSDENIWVISPREQWHNKFLNLVSQLGEAYQKEKQWQSAIDSYQRGIQVDPIAERFYQGMMRCYVELGERAEALKSFETCKKKLQSHLGVAPSATTIELYNELREG